jgi:hypothetical protein
MQRQTDDARATARGAMRKQLDLAAKLADALERLAQVEQAAQEFLDEATGGHAPIGNWDGFNARAERLRALVGYTAPRVERGDAG